MKAPLNEIFESIQGEGKYVGARQLFIRLSGCPLSCYYCDTDHREPLFIEVNGLKYKNPLGADELADLLFKHFEPGLCHSIAVTGGEPLLYSAFLEALSTELKKRGNIRLFLESSAYDPALVAQVADCFDIMSLDLKDREDFEAHTKSLIDVLKDIDSIWYLKLVVDKESEPLVIKTATLLQGHVDEIWLQPVDNIFEAELIARWQKIFAKHKIEAYFVPQVHKLLNIL